MRTLVHRVRARACGLWRSLLIAVATGTLLGGLVPAWPPASAASAQTLRIWYGSDDPTEPAWVTGLVQQFRAQHRGLTVQFSFYSLDDMNDKAQLALGSGNPPDLLYTVPRGPGLPAYVHAGKLRDLAAEARAHGWAQELRPGLLASYNGTLAANGSASAAGPV